MIEEYLIWKRMQDHLKEQKDQLEEQLYMNKHLSLVAFVHIKDLEKRGKVPQKKLK